MFNKRGQAKIIVIVLIILIVIVGVALVYNIVNPFIKSRAGDIETAVAKLQLPLLSAEGLVYDGVNEVADVIVKAGSGKGVITKAVFNFETSSGDCLVTHDINIKPLETRPVLSINVGDCGEVTGVNNIGPVEWGSGESIPVDTEISDCTDSDGGPDQMVKGITQNTNIIHEDYCLDNSTVMEGRCFLDNVIVLPSNCVEGYRCSDGACEEIPIILEIDSCQNITESGDYILTQNIASPDYSGNRNCINIKAENVILDCQGHSIKFKTAVGKAGVYSNYNNTEIRNCKISTYEMSKGISLESSSFNHLINNSLTKNQAGIALTRVSNTLVINNAVNYNKIGFYPYACSMNIVKHNNFNLNIIGIYFGLDSGGEISDNSVCDNSRVDVSCRGSSGAIGTGNRFTSVTPCADAWPIEGVNYEDCTVLVINPYLIEENIGVLEYSQTIVDGNCEVLGLNCENNKVTYYSTLPGIESVEAIVEVPESGFTNEQFENYVINAYSGWADEYEKESWKGTDNVYMFLKENEPIVNYIIAWYKDDKIILNKLNNWNTSIFEEDYLEDFIDAYLLKHPSDYIVERDKCGELDNRVKLEIDDLEAGGDVVVLREGDKVYEHEFFVTQSGYGGQIWEIRDFDIGGYEVTIEEEKENSSSVLISLIDEGDYYSGSFILKSGEVANIKVYEEGIGNYFLKATWLPENEIDTFSNCIYYRDSEFYIIIPEGATQEEWDLAFEFEDWIYDNSLTYRGIVTENQYVYRPYLDFSGGVAIKDNNRVMVFFGNSSPVQDVTLAIYFHEYLESLGVLSVCPIISSEEIGDDIMDSFCVEEGSCDSCGWFDLFCDEEECLGLSEGCYFIDIPLAPNECNSCSGLTCSSHLNESECYSGHCNLNCEWGDNTCYGDTGFNVFMDLSTLNNNYQVREIIKLTGVEV